MSVPPPPHRTTRGDKFVGSSDEEFSNEPPQLRRKAYRKKKSSSDSVSEGTDSGVESLATTPERSPTCAATKMAKSPIPKVQKTPLFKNAVSSVVLQANAAINVASRVRLEDSAIRRQTSEPEKTMCGHRLPSAAELNAHFGGKDFGEYDNGSVTVVRQYGIDLFSFK
ncbi:hypothetical protein AAVH_33382 [Aphelenchoides avenae]|nr:hypothetical protein AAVH_33382 [Aphelenchus avenae]